MSDIEKIQLFESKKVRTLWVEEDKWYFVLEDVIGILTCVILNSLKGGYKLYPSFRYKQKAALKRCVVPIWKGCSALFSPSRQRKQNRSNASLA